MTEHDKISSDVEATASSEQVVAPSQGRRRFTKGALLATPAVMTLMSGRLAAAASMTCRDKAGSPAVGWTDGVHTLELKDGVLGYYSDQNTFVPFSTSNEGQFYPSTSCLNSFPN